MSPKNLNLPIAEELCKYLNELYPWLQDETKQLVQNLASKVISEKDWEKYLQNADTRPKQERSND